MRARTRNLLLLAAATATAAVAWLLLGDRDPVPPPAAEGKPVPARRAAGGPGAPGSSREAAPPPPVPEGPRLDLRAVVEGEWGLGGIQVLPAERFPDGTFEAWIGEDAPDGGETDAEGRITLRYKSEPPERLFAVLKDDAILDRAENAVPAGEIRGRPVFRAEGAGPVTLRYRDPAGLVLLHPVDAATGEVLAGRAGILCTWTWQSPGEEAGVQSEEPYEKYPGWLKVTDTDAPEIRDLRLAVPGYLPSPAPAGGWRGRAVLPMRTDPGAVRGRVVVPAGTTAWAALRSVPGGRECDAADLFGVPRVPGAFAMGGVPPGEWDLVVRAAKHPFDSEEVSWAVRRFDFRGAGIDLGEIRLQPGSAVRARVVDREGDPVPEAKVLLALRLPGGEPILAYSRWNRGVSMKVSWPGHEDQDEWQREKEPGEEGWVEFRGLRPGASYLLATSKVPGLSRILSAPSKPGEVVAVELDGGCALTTCVLRFTIEGDEPQFWGGFAGPAYRDQFSTGKGILEADIPPGRHRLRVGAAPGPEPDYRAYEAEVEIPDSGRYEATVDLQPRER